MTKTVLDKIGVKEGMRSIFINLPEEVTALMDSRMLDMRKRLSGKFDYIHCLYKLSRNSISSFLD